MAVSWEQTANVLVGILHTENTTMAWSFGFRNLIIPGQVMGVAGLPFAHARNTICQQCLLGGFSHVLMYDSDIVPPRDALLRLLAHKVPVISALYSRRSPPHSIPVMLRNGQWITDYSPGEVVEVDWVGSGFLLIHRDVLVEIAKNPNPFGRPEAVWFDWCVDRKGYYPDNVCVSEDFALCNRIKKELKIKILVDTGVVVRHIGLAESTHNSFVPLNSTPIT